MKNENKKNNLLLNLRISNELFMKIDSLRVQNLLDHKRIPTRSEMVRILLNEALFHRNNEL